ncbi:MAG: hypothetical protein AB7I30_00410 [Isosphaeraceae bacterium]
MPRASGPVRFAVALAVVIVVGFTAVAPRPARIARADEPARADLKERMKAPLDLLKSQAREINREAAKLKERLHAEAAKVQRNAPPDDLLTFGGEPRLREEYVQTTIRRIEAEALLEIRKGEWADRKASREKTLDSRILRAYREEPESQERAIEIRKAEIQLTEAERLGRVPEDPTIVRAKERLNDLREKDRVAFAARRPEIAARLDAVDNQSDEANRLREARERAFTLRAVEARLKAILDAARHDEDAKEAAARVERLREEYDRVRQLNDAVNRQIERIQFETGRSDPPPAK